jgi:hypothetical protein
MEPAELKRIEDNHSAAVARARRDRKDGKFMPDAKFWKQHPEYGYVDTPLPILDTGTHGVYMQCPSGAILAPTAARRANGRSPAYFDKEVEKECQGIIDSLGKLYSPY